MIIVDQPGPLTTIQDLGRPGLAHLGVSPSGAADRTAHRLANRLVGILHGCLRTRTLYDEATAWPHTTQPGPS